MNHRMWLHPATQANIATLRARGVHVVGPDDGPLAEGESGPGRMVEPRRDRAALARGAHERSSTLTGLRVVVSAGPTYEDLDPVRFLGNRSSGKMGFAIAAAAARRGARGRAGRRPGARCRRPTGVQRIDVRSAAQMHEAVLGALPADVYVGAAAVADFTPGARRPAARSRKSGEDALTLAPGAHARHPGRRRRAMRSARALVVGFAAETDDVAAYARGKLEAKRLDLIAANRVGVAGSGFESDDNALIVVLARRARVERSASAHSAPRRRPRSPMPLAGPGWHGAHLHA